MPVFGSRNIVCESKRKGVRESARVSRISILFIVITHSHSHPLWQSINARTNCWGSEHKNHPTILRFRDLCNIYPAHQGDMMKGQSAMVTSNVGVFHVLHTHTHHYLHSTPLSSHTHTHTHKPDCALFRQDLFFAISSFLPGLTCSTLLLICSIFTVLFTIAAPWQWHAFARWTATVKLLWRTRLSTYEWKQQRDVSEIKYQLMLRGVFRDAGQ